MANTPMRVHSVQQIQDYARAYAEQCRAGVVVTDAMVERAADAISKVRCLGPMKECHSLMARAAIQSAFADDEGVKS